MIWLAGNRGMLGRAQIRTDREVDTTDLSSIDALVSEHRPERIVSCAAYAGVDLAEEQQQQKMST